MLYEFVVYPMIVEEHSFWVAESKALKGCVGQGDTPDVAFKELEANEQEWINSAKKYGITIPQQVKKTGQQYSGKLTLRVSSYTHEKASVNAKDLGVSLNQYLNDAVVTYNAQVEKRNVVVTYKENQNTSEVCWTKKINLFKGANTRRLNFV